MFLDASKAIAAMATNCSYYYHLSFKQKEFNIYKEKFKAQI